jgi:hypothetical protein
MLLVTFAVADDLPPKRSPSSVSLVQIPFGDCHGRSDAFAFKNAPRTAPEAASSAPQRALSGLPKKWR